MVQICYRSVDQGEKQHKDLLTVKGCFKLTRMAFEYAPLAAFLFHCGRYMATTVNWFLIFSPAEAYRVARNCGGESGLTPPRMTMS